MKSGLNQDVEILGKTFHLQTEVRGTAEPCIRTEVFVGGKLVATREVQLESADRQDGDEDAVRALLKKQHNLILTSLTERARHYQERRHGGPLPTRPAPQPPKAAPGDRERDPAPPSAASTETVNMALRVRRLFEGFRLRTGVTSTTPSHDLDQDLEKAADGFTWILESPIFSEIRVDEQIKIHLLRDEVDEWLHGDRDQDRGVRVWSELVTFHEYLGDINNRSELAAFDRDLILWAIHRIQGEGISERIVEHLGFLYGRDLRLDGLLDRPQGITSDVWIDDLRRGLAELERAEDS
ncbi:MAG: hypothetical protein GY856_13045 [bacterium]|nr:hypothetical protein [bacterium]